MSVATALGLLAALAVDARDLKPYAGNPLPPSLELADLSGQSHSLARYRGHVVLINFWTTWCPPCVEEIPALQRLKQRMAGKPFKILAVNVREPRELSERFLRRFSANFTVLLDPKGETVRPWKVHVFPASFLVGPEGRIRFAVNGALDWDEGEALRAIERLLPNRSREGPVTTQEERAPSLP